MITVDSRGVGNDQNDTVMIGRSAGQHLLDVAGVPLALDACAGGLPCLDRAVVCHERTRGGGGCQEPGADMGGARRLVLGPSELGPGVMAARTAAQGRGHSRGVPEP